MEEWRSHDAATEEVRGSVAQSGRDRVPLIHTVMDCCLACASTAHMLPSLLLRITSSRSGNKCMAPRQT
eukprot:SAG25_NODE_98_length_15733_cov_18.939237_12_plen_69_part_00